jgi:hypothetical protein
MARLEKPVGLIAGLALALAVAGILVWQLGIARPREPGAPAVAPAVSTPPPPTDAAGKPPGSTGIPADLIRRVSEARVRVRQAAAVCLTNAAVDGQAVEIAFRLGVNAGSAKLDLTEVTKSNLTDAALQKCIVERTSHLQWESAGEDLVTKLRDNIPLAELAQVKTRR